MMRRIFKIWMTMFFLGVIFLASAPVFAENKIKEILPPDTVKSVGGGKNLPTGDFLKDILPQAIKILLGLVGVVTFVVFVYSGVMLVVSQGNDEDVKKFKEMLTWSIVGLTFAVTSYALVRGLLQIVLE